VVTAVIYPQLQQHPRFERIGTHEKGLVGARAPPRDATADSQDEIACVRARMHARSSRAHASGGDGAHEAADKDEQDLAA